MRSQHVTFTERSAVLNKIHEALADVTFHSDQTEILKEIVGKFEENFDGASPEGVARNASFHGCFSGRRYCFSTSCRKGSLRKWRNCTFLQYAATVRDGVKCLAQRDKVMAIETVTSDIGFFVPPLGIFNINTSKC